VLVGWARTLRAKAYRLYFVETDISESTSP
jgi:hypothetical protein